MKHIILGAAALLLLAVPAQASGWYAFFDCGDGIVSKFGGYHGTSFVTVEDNHREIYAKDEPGGALINSNFSFRVKWKGRTEILRWTGNEGREFGAVSFGGRACRYMGETEKETNK